MPPKIKFSLNDIVDAALAVVRRGGLDDLTARAIAGELQSSTMPLYSCGRSMAEIEEEVVKRSWDILIDYQDKPLTGDMLVNMGLGYVMFAKHEKHLFGCIHSMRHMTLNKRYAELNFIRNLKMLGNYPPLAGVPEDIRFKILLQGWVFCHGLADILSKNIEGMQSGLEKDEDLVAFFLEANRINSIGTVNFVEESLKRRSLM